MQSAVRRGPEVVLLSRAPNRGIWSEVQEFRGLVTHSNWPIKRFTLAFWSLSSGASNLV
ncbi:hypothetical protein D3C72_2576000 [compost metagenome]